MLLAPSGGDATTLARAYEMVAPGGTIRASLAVYPGRLVISKSVNIVGVGESTVPTFEADTNPITVTAGNVTFTNISIRSLQPGGHALQVTGGTVIVRRSRIHALESATSPRRTLRAGDAALGVTGGTVTVEGSDLGPGFSHAAAVWGTGQLTIRDSLVNGPGTGLNAFEDARVTLNNNRFLTPVAMWGIALEDRVAFSVTNNRFANATAATWLCTVAGMRGTVSGNMDGAGAAYPNYPACPPPPPPPAR